MIEFSFVRSHMKGAPLVVSFVLLVFVLSVPPATAFTDAQFY